MAQTLYRRMSRAELEAQYEPLTLTQFVQARRRELRGTNTEFVVLVEAVGEGDVQLLPSDALACRSRTFWRARPRWAILENVPGLVSDDGGETLKQILQILEDMEDVY